MHKIPLVKPDLPPFDLLEDEFREILANGKITNFGRYVAAFEEEASAYLSAKVVTVSSGTAGLILGLQAVGVRPGDKVIVPSFTFMATAQAVLYAGAIPIFADIAPDLTLATDDLALLLDRHEEVTAVLPVHTYGLPANVEHIQAVVDSASHRRSRPIAVLYDAAPAFGSAVGSRNVGTFGDAEVFSLSATKVLVCVEGGAIASRNSAVIERVRHMRNYGIGEHYNTSWPGLNAKMSEFHALIGLHNLRRLPVLMEERQRKAHDYFAKIQAATACELLPRPVNITHTFKDITVLIPDQQVDRRDDILEALKQRGIECRTYFSPPLHRQDFFKRFADRSLPTTDQLARRVITLPFFTTMTDAEMDYVVQCLAETQAGALYRQ